MPCKNDMGNLSACTWKKITKWMKKLDDYYIMMINVKFLKN